MQYFYYAVIITTSFFYSVTLKVINSNQFCDVVKSSAFVDKTLLIREILKHNFILITAPRGFLKSTNLDMIKMFLSMPVNETGELDQKNKRERLDAFQTLNFYQMEKTLFQEYFAKFPVIHLNFSGAGQVLSYVDAFMLIKQRIHLSFLEHKYLCCSELLEEDERENCERWSGAGYHNISVESVRIGLSDLSRYLYKHFNCSKVYLLVDDYDSVISSSMYYVSRTELVHITTLVLDSTLRVLEDNPYVEGGILTGVTFISCGTFLKSSTLQTFKFLGPHDLVDFYGFSEEETRHLFLKPNFHSSEGEIKKAFECYTGYTSLKGRLIYNPISVLKFIEYGKARSFWLMTGDNENLEALWTFPVLNQKLVELMKNNSVYINNNSQLGIRELTELQGIFIGIPIHLTVSKVDLVLAYLIDLGYISYCCQSTSNIQRHSIRIANEEVWYYFFQQMKRFYVKKFKVDDMWFQNVYRFNFDNWFKEFSSFIEDLQRQKNYVR